jgi:hypothetical protein
MNFLVIRPQLVTLVPVNNVHGKNLPLKLEFDSCDLPCFRVQGLPGQKPVRVS